MLSISHWILGAALLASALSTQSASTPPCIGVMAASVSGLDGEAGEAGKAVRDVFVSFLTGPSMHPVGLEARVRQLAIEEARGKNCAFIVAVSVSRKRGGGGSALGSALGRAAGTAAWYMPGGAGVGGAVVRGVSIGAAEAVQQITSSTRAKDEMRLEWTLMPLSSPSASPTSKNEKLKASSDGEDLLTPLVQRAAETIVHTVLK